MNFERLFQPKKRKWGYFKPKQNFVELTFTQKDIYTMMAVRSIADLIKTAIEKGIIDKEGVHLSKCEKLSQPNIEEIKE